MSRSGFGRKGSEAPIILISGYDPSAVALRAEKLHIFDIIEKPFSREMICDAVKKAIGFSPTAEQGDAESVSPNTAEAAATKKKFSESRGNRSDYLSPARFWCHILSARTRALGERIGESACGRVGEPAKSVSAYQRAFAETPHCAFTVGDVKNAP